VRIHHLDCGTLCPPLARRLLGHGHMVCHCLLVEHPAGLVLVDSGIGTADIDHPGRLPRGFRLLAGDRLRRAATAVEQVRSLGFDPHDVRHLVLTHLDLDHAGGIADFPWATLHVHRRELAAARARATLTERQRYLPAQLAAHQHIATYDEPGEPWLGLQAVRPLGGLGDDLALIPLFGHTRGHSGVAVRGPSGWLLHAGDAYFHRAELDAPTAAPLGLRLFQRLMATDDGERRANQARLRELAAARRGAVTIFSSHDPAELAGLARPAAPPVAPPVAPLAEAR
jgi:glyoxylase-like metal-dependent hydrolase (beta-lactamase superfamily II)